MSTPLKIIFAGTPDFAAKHLAALIKSPHQVVAVYCPPDKPAGRGKKLTACATKQLALENNITVEQPINFKDVANQEKLASYNADVMIVVAYGLLLPEIILTTPKLGCINVHGSLLPKWRGAAPIQRSLEAGDAQTGITIMQMDKGLDTGAMISTAACNILSSDTSASLYEKLALLGPAALIDALSLIQQESFLAENQNNDQASYAHKLDKAEAECDWQLTADQLDRKIRAYNPWPFAQFTYTDKNNKEHRIRILQASVIEKETNKPIGTIVFVDKKQGIGISTGKNILCLEILQLPSKKALPVSDILNGKADWFVVDNHINGLPLTLTGE